ncbi:hypothetical protein [Flavobacterium wongokense]|uniref:hypothetical protein n=1 Tax=Flavobacterium wongokense TaxID=2910674 RepID=UPI001F4686FA|nr:hypothetical protein [Flavobacterium sp. WG47]MCF6132726.1 hypothetical protein [Flavobacterium sp. WG47]
MKSEIWNNESSRKAFSTGYEENEIEIFDVECEAFLREVMRQSAFLNDSFKDEDISLHKANWLILNEITSSLYDCHQNIIVGNIRIASRIFRDVLENMHILELINNSNKPKYLQDWYNNEVISHREYRNWIKTEKTEELSELTREVYRLYSKYSHRTYKSILESYSKENEQTLRFHAHLNRKIADDLKLLSTYYSHLSYFVKNTTLNYGDYKVLQSVQMSIIAEMFVK